ncbi:MAG TPA: beta-N-acetylhexosaminidase [Burkholderiales bacterium]|nr:beta-N-acetylhexosaminidase [Burkholderiales bacterium]
MRRVRSRLPLGPVMLDPIGTALTEDDVRRLRHPAVGGAILFARNFESPAQLTALTEDIHALREPALLIGVDHEGGRVQRFQAGFTRLPPMRLLGEAWDRDRETASKAAHGAGYVMGAELSVHGLDFSFAPVLDLDYGSSSVIGDRALHYDPLAVGALAAELIRGMGEGGMAAVGKHFPGHGFAAADSHVALPRDERPLAELMRKDLAPYRRAIAAGLSGIMPAHVVYPRVDDTPAGYSPVWLRDVLRAQLGFDGLIFSDDLSMEGARTAGGVVERAQAALRAGCDMVLLCNDPDGQERLLGGLGAMPLEDATRAERMRHRGGADLRRRVAYREALAALAQAARPTA